MNKKYKGRLYNYNMTISKELDQALMTFLNQKEDILGITVPIKMTKSKFIEDAIREKLIRETKNG